MRTYGNGLGFFLTENECEMSSYYTTGALFLYLLYLKIISYTVPRWDGWLFFSFLLREIPLVHGLECRYL